MNKLARLIENLDETDLKLIRKDLKAGNIEKLINKRIKEKKEENPNEVCPVCNSPIGEENVTLIFGPKDLRKKASFDGIDCLEYFLDKVKMRKKIIGKQHVEP